MLGKTISHYKILKKLGEGGMSVVYKAEDMKFKLKVNLKTQIPEEPKFSFCIFYSYRVNYTFLESNL